jgi:hypothetical protein
MGDETSAETGSCNPNRLPNPSTIDSCLKNSCCWELTTCAADSICWSCFNGTRVDCSTNWAFASLLSCETSCGTTGDASIDAPVAAEAGTDAGPIELTLAMIHASATLWPFRVCLQRDDGLWATPAPLPDDPSAVMPHTNVVGVAPGGALLVPNAQDFNDNGAAPITPYLIRTDSLKPYALDAHCKDLICGVGSCLKKDFDYIAGNPQVLVPVAGTGVAVVYVYGCIGSAGSAERCGADYAKEGNLKVAALPSFSIDSTEPGAGTIRVRVVQTSQSAEAVWLRDAGASAGMSLVYGALDDPDAGKTLLDNAPFGTLQPTVVSYELATPQLSDADLPLYARQGFTVRAASGDAGIGPVLKLSLAEVQDLSKPTELPPSFWNGSTDFLIALVGDVTQSAVPVALPDGGHNPLFDGYGLHVIAVPLRVRTPIETPGED